MAKTNGNGNAKKNGKGSNGRGNTDPAVIPQLVVERPPETVSQQFQRWARMERYLHALRLTSGDTEQAKKVSAISEESLVKWRKWNYELKDGETFEHSECQLLIESPLAVLSVVRLEALAGNMKAAQIFLLSAPSVIGLKHHVLQTSNGSVGGTADYGGLDVSAEFEDLIAQTRPVLEIAAEVEVVIDAAV